LSLPLLTGAIRYARNGLTVGMDLEHVPPLPGLGTVYFAFLSVTGVFLDVPRVIDAQRFAWMMTTVVVLFSLLMVSPITYPKLVAFRGASPLVIVLLACMPFLGKRFFAAVMLVAGLLYAILAPILVCPLVRK
jgi:phosphatidylserine synthase